MILKIHYVSGGQENIIVPEDELEERLSKILEHDLVTSVEVVK